MIQTKKSLSLFTLSALLLTAILSQAAQESGEMWEAEEAITLPEGTVIPIVLTAYLNTKNSQVGDIVYATTIYPIWFQQQLVIPRGSEIRGTLTDVARPGRIEGKGRMVIRFDDILLPNGVKRDITATLRGIHGPGDESLDRGAESVESGGSEGEDAGTIAGSAVSGISIGTLVGAASGHTVRGMEIGAGVGVAAGIVQVLLTRGKDLVLEPGTQFDLELLGSLEFSYYELQFTDNELSNAERSAHSVNQSRRSDSPERVHRDSWPRPGFGFPFPF